MNEFDNEQSKITKVSPFKSIQLSNNASRASESFVDEIPTSSKIFEKF